MDESSPITCDVLVMGGGPAGSAAATWLARSGYSTILLEKEVHPRFHIGESLLPLSLPYLEDLGVLEQVESLGLRKYAAEFHSPYHGRHTTFRFEGALGGDYPYAYEVPRATFDEVLFRNAEQAGARTFEGCRVDAAELKDDVLTSITATNAEGQRLHFKARFYIDATGRETFLAETLKTKRRNPRHKSAAVYAHYQGVVRNTGESEGNIAIYWFDHGWFWMIPLKGDLVSVGAVLQPEYLKSRAVPLERFLEETIAMAPGVAARLEKAERVSPVTGTGNYSYRSTRMSGRNFLMVGDAYAFIDPVFSSGVHLALNGAFEAQKTVAHILSHPEKARRALRDYEKGVHRGLGIFSWFIYRVRTAAIRDLFMNPRDFFGMQKAIVSVLAGDLYRNTPLWGPLIAFRWVYHVKALAIRLRLSPPVTP